MKYYWTYLKESRKRQEEEIWLSKIQIKPEELNTKYGVKFLHLSSQILGGNYNGYTFTPRIPRGPYLDVDQTAIEDDMTPRISLAPSIEKATKALPDATFGGYAWYIYVLTQPTPTIRPDQERTSEKLDTEYDTDFNMSNWINNKWPTKKREKFFNKLNQHLEGPKDLPPRERKKFIAAVPDADETEEVWSVKPTFLELAGVYYPGKNIVVLAKKFAAKHKNAL